jgi:hypothetical protein
MINQNGGTPTRAYIFTQGLAYVVTAFYLISTKVISDNIVLRYFGFLLLSAFFILMCSVITSIVLRRYFDQIDFRIMSYLDMELKPVLPILTVASLITKMVDKVTQKESLNVSLDTFLWIITIALVVFIAVQILDYLKDNVPIGVVLLIFIAILIVTQFVSPNLFTMVFVAEAIVAFLLGIFLRTNNRTITQNSNRQVDVKEMSDLAILDYSILLFAGIIAYFAQEKVIEYCGFFTPGIFLLCIEATILTITPVLQLNNPYSIVGFIFRVIILILLLSITYIIWVIWHANHASFYLALIISLLFSSVIFWPIRNVIRKTLNYSL